MEFLLLCIGILVIFVLFLIVKKFNKKVVTPPQTGVTDEEIERELEAQQDDSDNA